jgi:hypothetical protein
VKDETEPKEQKSTKKKRAKPEEAAEEEETTKKTKKKKKRSNSDAEEDDEKTEEGEEDDPDKLPKEMFKLEEAHQKYKQECERGVKACLLATPSRYSKGYAYYVFTRKNAHGLAKRYPRFHEAIHPGQPMRLLLDFDLKAKDVPPQQNVHEVGTKMLASILAQVRGLLMKARKHLKEPEDEPIILLGSRADKYSVHVVYPTCWFKSPAHLLKFMEPLPKAVDRAPIKRAIRSVSFIRMPFARRCVLECRSSHPKSVACVPKCKMGHVEVEASELLPQTGEKYSADFLSRACVSVGMADPPPEDSMYVNVTIPEDLLNAGPKDDEPGPLDPETRMRVKRSAMKVIRYMGVPEGQIVKMVPSSAEEWKAYIPPVLFCGNLYATKGRLTHQRNESLLRMFRDVDGKLRVCNTCLDLDCGGWSRVCDEDFTHLYTTALTQPLPSQGATVQR